MDEIGPGIECDVCKSGSSSENQKCVCAYFVRMCVCDTHIHIYVYIVYTNVCTCMMYTTYTSINDFTYIYYSLI